MSKPARGLRDGDTESTHGMNTAQHAFVRCQFEKWVEETDVAEQCGITRKEMIDSVEFNDRLEFNHLHVVHRGYITNEAELHEGRMRRKKRFDEWWEQQAEPALRVILGYQPKETGDPKGEPPHCRSSVTPPPVALEPSWEECMESAGIAVTDAHRRVVAQLESTGFPDIGYLLTVVLRSPTLSVADAAEGIRKLMG